MVFDYPEFEAYFRGSREEVLRKQGSYLPFIQQLAIDHEHPVLDIACGRGEWLELLRENGIPAEGVELNHEFATHCKGNGLIVENADLFDFFSRAEGKTYKLITGFHIIEHLSLEQQQEFLEKALERLAPGGAMLLETPNPENTSVGCCDFYLDPTHVRPLPPLLLQFLVHQAGFSSPFIVRLNRFIVGTPLRLMPESFQYADIFNQLVRLISTQLQQAPDYALIGFKGHAPTDSALKILNQIILESENYSPKETSSDNQVNLLQQNEFFALMKEQLRHREEEYHTALTQLRERERELKSVYRTAAGQFILYYKSVKNKWKKNNASSEQFEVPHNTDQEVVHDEPSRSKSVQYVYMQLLNARQRNRMKHHNS